MESDSLMDDTSTQSDQIMLVTARADQFKTTRSGDFKCSLFDYPSLYHINSELFSGTEVGWVRSMISTFVALMISSLAILPYTVYSRQLLIGDWTLFCVIRPTAYLLVFFSLWHKLLTGKNSHWGTWRILVNCIFACIYTGLYAIKWAETPGIYVRYLSIPCFSMSWFIVFYEVMDRYVSTRSPSGSIDHRRKKCLLYAIRQQEAESWSQPEFARFVSNSLEKNKNLSVLIAKHANSCLFPITEEDSRLGVYEAVAYNTWEEKITTLVDLTVGFSFVPLLLALIEDYGYSLYKLVSNEDIFLSLILVLCGMLSLLYLVSTYPIYNKMLLTLSKIITDTREVLFSLGRRIPLYFIACVCAMTRVNASYSMFGSIAGRMSVPINLGLVLIWLAVIVVALVDFSATLKILSRSFKYCWMTACMNIPLMTYTEEYTRYAVIRYYNKRLKRIVRNSCENDISLLSGHLL